MRAYGLLLCVLLAGCGRYSAPIRSAYTRGNLGVAATRCAATASAAESRWAPGHRARYHLYCGMTYLRLGDRERAASELVYAERIRLQEPRLLRGRDLDELSDGLVALFGVPAGQLEITVAPAVALAPLAPTQIASKGATGPAPLAEPAIPIVPESPTDSDGADQGLAPDAPAAIEIGVEAPEQPIATEPTPPLFVIPEDQAIVVE